MKRLTILLIFIIATKVMAQEDNLHIILNEGNPVEINASDIKDMTFVDDTEPLDIVGEWFCEAESLGAYESFEFYEDGSVNYFYFYINYQSGGSLNGTFSFEDYVLKVKVRSIPLQKFPVVDHSNTHFTTLSSGLRFNYYKVQKTYYMTTKDIISIGNEGDVVTYVDKQFIGLEDNKIKPLKAGTGYALVMDAQLNTIVAYKVIVQNNPPTPIDWTKYFLKDKNDITNEFGVPTEIRVDSNLQTTIYSYEGYNAAISRLMFEFDNATEKVRQVSVNLRTESYFDAYHNYIKGKYVYHENLSTPPTELVYYDTDDKNTASVMIDVFFDPSYNILMITFVDLR